MSRYSNALSALRCRNRCRRIKVRLYSHGRAYRIRRKRKMRLQRSTMWYR